jgi:hypothetical protein
MVRLSLPWWWFPQNQGKGYTLTMSLIDTVCAEEGKEAMAAG